MNMVEKVLKFIRNQHGYTEHMTKNQALVLNYTFKKCFLLFIIYTLTECQYTNNVQVACVLVKTMNKTTQGKRKYSTTQITWNTGLFFSLVLGWFHFTRAPITVNVRIICIQKTLHAQPLERSVDISSSQNRGFLLHTT